MLKVKYTRYMTMERAGLIFAAQDGDRKAIKKVKLWEVNELEPADTFDQFLAINHIKDINEVQRDY